jgi:hypothetical protein
MARRVINLMGHPVIDEESKAADATITPGHLLEFVGTDEVQRNTNVVGMAVRRVALERDEIGRDIDHAYEQDEVVKVGVFAGGQRAYLFTPSGQNIVRGSLLQPDGSGRVVWASGWGIAEALAAPEPPVPAAAVQDFRVRAQFI